MHLQLTFDGGEVDHDKVVRGGPVEPKAADVYDEMVLFYLRQWGPTSDVTMFEKLEVLGAKPSAGSVRASFKRLAREGAIRKAGKCQGREWSPPPWTGWRWQAK